MRYKKTKDDKVYVYLNSKPGSPLLCIYDNKSQRKTMHAEDEKKVEEIERHLQELFPDSVAFTKTAAIDNSKPCESTTANPKEIKKDLPEKEKTVAPKDTTILNIFCEGITEANYLISLATCLEIKDRVRVTSYGGGDPHLKFKNAVSTFLWKKQFSKKVSEEIWFVFDRDGHEHYKEIVNLDFDKADVNVAWTNPCIEYWFLLHIKKYDNHLLRDIKILNSTKRWSTCDKETYQVHDYEEKIYDTSTSSAECLRTLRRYVPKYSKSSTENFSFFAETLPLALEKCTNTTNPFAFGSSLPNLIYRMFKMAGLDKETALEKITAKDKTVLPAVTGDKITWKSKDYERFKTLLGQVPNSSEINQANCELLLNFIEVIRKEVLARAPECVQNAYKADKESFIFRKSD